MKKSPKRKTTYHPSAINTRLKVSVESGIKVLNTIDANYSYGGLQEVLEFGLDHIPFEGIDNALVLGLGAGSVVDSLRNKYRFEGEITGVEIDPVVLQIAREEFEIERFEHLKIVEADAAEFVKKTRKAFDLIVIDIFINVEVPEVFYGEEFWKNIAEIVSKNGFVLFNAGINWEKGKKYSFLKLMPPCFMTQAHNLEGNTLLINQKLYV